MKRKLLIICGALCAILFLTVGVWYLGLLPVGSFDLNDEYLQEIINNPTRFSPEDFDIEYPPQEPICTAGQARALARKIWLQAYEEKTIFSDRPYQLAYDAANKVWWVTGSLPFEGWIDSVGGTPNLLVSEETGEILAIWHSK